MGMDLSYLEALMGGATAETGEQTGGVWIISPDGMLDDGMLRLVGKARVVADALGGYVYLLAGGAPLTVDPQRAIQAGADQVLIASGVPTVSDLVDFFRERAPQAVLFPRTQLGRALGPALAQMLGGGLCGHAADLAVDPIYQRIIAHQPVLDDAARQIISLVAAPAVAVVDTAVLPAAFNEPWRTGVVQDAGPAWTELTTYPTTNLPVTPISITSAPVVVAAGLGLKNIAGFALATALAEALGGAIAGDVGALDAGWITEQQLVGLTGHAIAPKLYLALGIDGDTSQFMALQDAGCVVAVQPDPAAPFVPVADYNIIADPATFAHVLLAALGK